jgi:hypothetical protein
MIEVRVTHVLGEAPMPPRPAPTVESLSRDINGLIATATPDVMEQLIGLLAGTFAALKEHATPGPAPEGQEE